ncbi:matrix metalloproteinase-2-like isoform X2 [Lycorma delicatula]
MQAFANIPATGIMDKETVRLLGKARCGVADMQIQRNKRRKRYTIQGQKWHHTNITWSLQSRRLLSLDHGRVRKELYRALNVWSKHSLLNFQEVNSPNADILIYFERGNHNDGYPFDGKGKILAHAFFPGSGRGGDAHFDEDEIWQLEGDSNDVDGSTSLFAVAAHEFGHSLGLSHSSVKGALMYPWYQGLQENFELPEDDRYGIQQLYGARTKLWSEIPKYYPTDKGRQDPNKGGRDPYRGQYPGRPTPVNPPRYYPTPRTTTTTTTTTTPAPRVTPHPRGDKPDTCDSSYDAISVIRSETFIFKDRYMWRIGDEGLYKGYPVLIHRLWNKLPANLTHVDAVYERLDKKIVFFIGRQYYVFNTNNLEPGYPRPLTALGLPSTLDQIDAVMVWGHNSKTYFFAGTVYWRYDEEIKRVELDYPRDMRVWKGVGYYIDAVFQWKDGATYFFKGKGFWKFNDLRMRVESERQMLSSMFWMKCPQVESEKPKNGTDSNDVNDVNDDSSSGSKLGNLFILIYTLSLFLLIYNNASY